MCVGGRGRGWGVRGGGGISGLERRAVVRECGLSRRVAIRIRRQGNTNRQHHVNQDLMKKSGFIALGVVTFDVILMA